MTSIRKNKNHGGKEFSNRFHFVGKVSPVQRKEQDSDNWNDLPFYEDTITATNRDRKVVQFMLETAPYNRLKVELAGMEMQYAYAYSRTNRKSHRLDWADRHEKSKYPDETYHLIDTDWDKTIKFGNMIQDEMWVDVRGHYEFDSFETEDGREIKLVKRIIDYLTPLRNGEIEISGLKEGDTFRVFDAEEEGNFMGQGKANKEGIASIRVGWLNPEGGKIFICKVDENGVEGSRVEQEYTEGTVKNDRFTVTNNIPSSSIRVNKTGGGYEYIDYHLDFSHEDFKELNSFEMQIGIRSTYQDDETGDTKINAVYLDYGKDRSTPKDVELMVYHKDVEEGKTSLATAFSRLNYLDFMTVEGIDNNRAETTMVAVEEQEEDNPFEDVGEKIVSYERVTTGTRKGLEVLNYVGGTYIKELLTEEEIMSQADIPIEDPFATVEVSDDDLPF